MIRFCPYINTWSPVLLRIEKLISEGYTLNLLAGHGFSCEIDPGFDEQYGEECAKLILERILYLLHSDKNRFPNETTTQDNNSEKMKIACALLKYANYFNEALDTFLKENNAIIEKIAGKDKEVLESLNYIKESNELSNKDHSKILARKIIIFLYVSCGSYGKKEIGINFIKEYLLKKISIESIIAHIYEKEEDLSILLGVALSELSTSFAMIMSEITKKRPKPRIPDTSFIKPFIYSGGSVFTTNYDYYLDDYIEQAQQQGIPVHNGSYAFRPEYNEWFLNDHKPQNVFWLHGHIGHTSHSKKGTITEMRSREQFLKYQKLYEQKLPLICKEQGIPFTPGSPVFFMGSILVAASMGKIKLEQIALFPGYAECALTKFREMLNNSNAILAVYGHSLNRVDSHICEAIENSKIAMLIVAIYGDQLNKTNQLLIKRTRKMWGDRDPENLIFVDAASMDIRGKNHTEQSPINKKEVKRHVKV